MKLLAKYKTALHKAQSKLQESASTVDALNRQMSRQKATFRMTGAKAKFAKVKKEVQSRFSPTAEVTLNGDDIVVVAPMKGSLEMLLKRFGTVTKEG